jgi:cytochrome bd-type quinol oxidase subunit 2
MNWFGNLAFAAVLLAIAARICWLIWRDSNEAVRETAAAVAMALITLAMRLTILPVVWVLALTIGRRQSRKQENGE